MRTVDMSPEAVRERLMRVSMLADLTPERRCDAKLDMSARGVAARIEEAGELLRLCVALGAFGAR